MSGAQLRTKRGKRTKVGTDDDVPLLAVRGVHVALERRRDLAHVAALVSLLLEDSDARDGERDPVLCASMRYLSATSSASLCSFSSMSATTTRALTVDEADDDDDDDRASMAARWPEMRGHVPVRGPRGRARSS